MWNAGRDQVSGRDFPIRLLVDSHFERLVPHTYKCTTTTYASLHGRSEWHHRKFEKLSQRKRMVKGQNGILKLFYESGSRYHSGHTCRAPQDEMQFNRTQRCEPSALKLYGPFYPSFLPSVCSLIADALAFSLIYDKQM